MNRMRSFLFTFLLLMCLSGSAQELKCQVEVNADKVSNTTGREVFKALQDAVSEYMNNTKFTEAQFSPQEKIECRLMFVIGEYSDNVMKGELQVQSSRPVYNSSYTTTLLNLKDDKIEFEYVENSPLTFSQTSIESNLTAILDFYAYIICGMDFDSFSPSGGDEALAQAERVVQMAQTTGYTGWKAFEDNRNRSALIRALLDRPTSSIRELMYDYHRKGFDEMAIAPDKSRTTITSSLRLLDKIGAEAPMSVILTMVRDAKLDEIVNVYSKANADERKEAVDILSRLYPADQNRIDRIKSEKR